QAVASASWKNFPEPQGRSSRPRTDMCSIALPCSRRRPPRLQPIPVPVATLDRTTALQGMPRKPLVLTGDLHPVGRAIEGAYHGFASQVPAVVLLREVRERERVQF